MSYKYKCTNCSYQFSTGTDRHVTKCPYCNKMTLRLIERGPNFVDKLIDET
jgi:predicted nucleic acid-binding Zn ribbon protein